MIAVLWDFVWYLVAFGLGALAAWLIVRSTVKARSADEAFADLPGSRTLEEPR